MTCLLCNGHRFVQYDLPLNHPQFGRAQPCPQCQGGEAGVRLRQLRSYCRVPARFRDAKPQDFAPDIAVALERSLEASRRQRQFITVWGGFGVGKTHLLCAAVNRAVENGLVGVYTTWGEILDHLRNAYANDVGEEADRFWQNLLSADVLAIDEVDKARMTDFAGERLFALVNARYNDLSHLTLFATNRRFQEGDAIAGDSPGAFESRLRERGNLVLRLGGPDRRRLAA